MSIGHPYIPWTTCQCVTGPLYLLKRLQTPGRIITVREGLEWYGARYGLVERCEVFVYLTTIYLGGDVFDGVYR